MAKWRHDGHVAFYHFDSVTGTIELDGEGFTVNAEISIEGSGADSRKATKIKAMKEMYKKLLDTMTEIDTVIKRLETPVETTPATTPPPVVEV